MYPPLISYQPSMWCHFSHRIEQRIPSFTRAWSIRDDEKDIYCDFEVILNKGCFLSATSGYIGPSVGPWVRRSVGPNFWKFWNLNFSALEPDRDLGFSRGHQYDDKDENEDDEEEVKDDKDDNKERDDGSREIIKCLNFSELQFSSRFEWQWSFEHFLLLFLFRTLTTILYSIWWSFLNHSYRRFTAAISVYLFAQILPNGWPLVMKHVVPLLS